MRAMLLWTAAAVAVMGLTWVVYRSAAPGPSPPRQAPTPKSSALVFRLHGPWLEGTGLLAVYLLLGLAFFLLP